MRASQSFWVHAAHQTLTNTTVQSSVYYTLSCNIAQYQSTDHKTVIFSRPY